MPEHRVLIQDRNSPDYELLIEPGGEGTDTVNIRVAVERGGEGENISASVLVGSKELADAVSYVNARENE